MPPFIKIGISAEGQLLIESNIQDKLQLIGLLEVAKKNFLDPPKAENARPLVLASGSLPLAGLKGR